VFRYHNLYPRMVTEDRGETWKESNLEGPHVAAYTSPDALSEQILGYIPQVEHTFGTFESLFGIMNDQQVSIGESTCAARFGGNALPRACVGCEGPLFEMTALSMIALERCATARCAVQMMGDLAVQHGFYGAEAIEDERGEALTVADTKEVREGCERAQGEELRRRRRKLRMRGAAPTTRSLSFAHALRCGCSTSRPTRRRRPLSGWRSACPTATSLPPPTRS
jgi:hypothetical protein